MELGLGFEGMGLGLGLASQNSHMASSKQRVVKERSPPLRLRASLVDLAWLG